MAAVEDGLFEQGVVEIVRGWVMSKLLEIFGERVCFDFSRSSGRMYHLLYGKSMPIVASATGWWIGLEEGDFLSGLCRLDDLLLDSIGVGAGRSICVRDRKVCFNYFLFASIILSLWLI